MPMIVDPNGSEKREFLIRRSRLCLGDCRARKARAESRGFSGLNLKKSKALPPPVPRVVESRPAPSAKSCERN